MAEKKITKRERYNELLNLGEVQMRPELVEFIEHELELLARKNTTSTGEKKLTPLQKANEELKSAIYDFMEDGVLYPVSEIVKSCPACEGLTTSKVSAMVTQLKNENKIAKVEEKRKAYYYKGELMEQPAE